MPLNHNMKKILIAAALLCGFQTTTTSLWADVQVAENLDRGLVVIKTSQGNLIQWRILPSDIENGYTYTLRGYSATDDKEYENIATFTTSDPSCYLDNKSSYGRYKMYTKSGSTTITAYNTAIVSPSASQLTQIQTSRPAAVGSVVYTPNDASVGDVDGDGQYELILKWNPSNGRDNSQSGKTANVYFDCYEITGSDAGKQLWRIDMGQNIRAGAHYSPFLVYDFDGDGKAEFVLKTAPGTKDASGAYVSAAGATTDIQNITTNASDLRNSNGHVTSGEEFLTIFNGATGNAIQTIWYNPNRGQSCGSASTYGTWESVAGKSTNYNRGERYNACVAYLDGLDKLPSIVMQRGYYTQAYFWAVDWDGTNLTTRWLHRGTSSSAWSVVDGNGTQTASGSGKSSFGQGVHGISVGDVDEDGYDEIVMGSATIDHDGRLLCSTGFGHGDAIHLGKFLPDRAGLQVFMPHEESSAKYGSDLHDAATGAVLYRGYTDGDNGRGMAADMIYSIDSKTGLDNYLGWELWSGAEDSPYNANTGKYVGSKPDQCFRIYWNGDLYDESFDGRYGYPDGTEAVNIQDNIGSCTPRIIYYDGSSNKTITLSTYGGTPRTCNATKATPCLTADLWGDWREEIVCWDDADPSVLDIYTTAETTSYPVPCLMTDHVYRMGVAWENSSYNQPPHLGYYLPDAFLCRYTPATLPDSLEVGRSIGTYVLPTRNVTTVSTTGTAFSLGIKAEYDADAQTLTLSGSISKTGKFSGTVTMSNAYNTVKLPLTFVVVEEGVLGLDGITAEEASDAICYDLRGRRIAAPVKGQMYICNGRKLIY